MSLGSMYSAIVIGAIACACEAVPDEKFEDGSAETTANVTEDHE